MDGRYCEEGNTYVVTEKHAPNGCSTSTKPDEVSRCGLFDGLEVSVLGNLEDGIVRDGSLEVLGGADAL